MKQLIPAADHFYSQADRIFPYLREEHRLRVFENRVLRKIFGPKRKTDNGENYIMMNFMACMLHLILLG
jgi:hypothetical protein